MSTNLFLSNHALTLDEAKQFIFAEEPGTISLSEDCLKEVRNAEHRLHSMMENKIPIYGVTTGFGASVFRHIPTHQSETLQRNLIAYLNCGTGEKLPRDAVRAMILFRLKSLSRGFSGVSTELLDRLQLLLNRDWIPVIPREGSLGASGDLIPLAYIARALQGEGQIETKSGIKEMASLLQQSNIPTYTLKAKEGLALVNGTSAMAGLAFINWKKFEYVISLSTMATSWACLALQGHPEAFSPLVNEYSKNFLGQKDCAQRISALITSEKYSGVSAASDPYAKVIQDKYSLRCAPQILGPVLDTFRLFQQWLECEVNGVSDNPLIGQDGSLAMGGNFYGGYISQGMDYLKISMAHVADMVDRQITYLMDENANRGLPANLANWHVDNKDEHFLMHGLKGLHQSASAITSELMAKSIPNGIFSRSSESHNQDKVSLGMSAAVQMNDMLPAMFNLLSLHFISLSQALDLRKIELRGTESKAMYTLVRNHVRFVTQDTPLDQGISSLSSKLQSLSTLQRGLFSYDFT